MCLLSCPVWRLCAGEMRALQPGDSTRVHTHALTGRVDFSGPAVIGMSALFCPAAMAAPEEDNGSADGGRVDGSNPLFLIADLLEEAGAKGDDPDR